MPSQLREAASYNYARSNFPAPSVVVLDRDTAMWLDRWCLRWRTQVEVEGWPASDSLGLT
jgi:hypothetical protein